MSLIILDHVLCVLASQLAPSCLGLTRIIREKVQVDISLQLAAFRDCATSSVKLNIRLYKGSN